MRRLLKVFGITLLVLFGLTFAFCRPKVTESTISTSPDGRYQVNLTSYDEQAGAISSTYSVVTLRDPDKSFPKVRRIVSLRGVPPMTVRWVGPKSIELDIVHYPGSLIYASHLPLAGWTIKVVEIAERRALPRPPPK